MAKLNPLPAKKMLKILHRLGFQEIRIRGSHHYFYNQATKKTVSVPVHGNEYLGLGILKEILKDINISVEEYERLRIKS